jgi:ATP-binding cassette subfamily A (ABC1) protein 3
MAFLASSFVLLLVNERRNKAKHVQFVSGVDAVSYWVSAYVWDFCNYMVPCFGIMVLFAVFQVDGFNGAQLQYVFVLFVLYGLSVIPMVYLASFLFETPSVAYTRLTMFNILTGLFWLVCHRVVFDRM